VALLCSLGDHCLRGGGPGGNSLPLQPWTYTLDPGGSGISAIQMKGWPLGPERDPSAFDLQTWKALVGQAQRRQTGIYFGNILSWKSILGPTGDSRRHLLRGGLPRDRAREGQVM